jgi:hypothetical protein
MAADHSVTRLLADARNGDEDALREIFPAVYKELRALAGSYLRCERSGHTLQPTALTHEAFLKLVEQDDAHWANRKHFNDPPVNWDAETGIAWFISPDNQPRSLDDHKTYLADVLNGGTSDGVDYACLSDGCDLELPTLAQLEKLGTDCAGIASLVVGPGGGDMWTYTGAQADLCAALWPDPSLGQPANCASSRTLGASDPTQAYAVCLSADPSGAGGAVAYENVFGPVSVPRRTATLFVGVTIMTGFP